MATERGEVLTRISKVIGVVAAILTFAIAVAALFMQYRDYKRAREPVPSPPPSVEDLYLKGTDLKNQRRYREAIEVFTEAAKQVRTETPAGQHQAALIQFSLGQCYLHAPADCKQANRCLALLTADESGLYDVLKTEYDDAPCH